MRPYVGEAYVSREDVIAGDAPRWDGAGRVHDWRNHVPEEVKKLWPTFSEIQRKALYDWANDLASAEEWE